MLQVGWGGAELPAISPIQNLPVSELLLLLSVSSAIKGTGDLFMAPGQHPTNIHCLWVFLAHACPTS
jgi:hypothetical protein